MNQMIFNRRRRSGRRRSRWPARLAMTLIALVAALLLFGWHIGYFGGPVFVDVPARAAPPAGTPRIAAVLLSGDMGFRVGMGPQIADRLAADGIPVVGVNSLTFFRRQRTPDEVRLLINQAARHALAFGHADQLVLIGQSFGADMMHVGLSGLPADLRAKVKLVALVVPTDNLIFRASPSELFDWATPDGPALPSARALNWVPVLCVHGEEEDASLCPMLRQSNVHSVALPGGHALHHDPDLLYATLRPAIETATTPISSTQG